MADPKGLLFVPVAFRSDGSIHALELDNSDRLKVVIDSITAALTVTQTTPSNLTVSNYGWDGSAWQKLLVDTNFSLNVSPIIRTTGRGIGKGETIANTALAAGTNNLDGSAVPGNKVWIIKSVSVQYNGTVAGVKCRINLILPSGGFTIIDFIPMVSTVRQQFSLDFPMPATSYVQLQITGATLNDDGFLTYVYEELT